MDYYFIYGHQLLRVNHLRVSPVPQNCRHFGLLGYRSAGWSYYPDESEGSCEEVQDKGYSCDAPLSI